MLRLTKLSNKFRRRTLRAQYAHTQGYPYAAILDSSFDRAAGQLLTVADSKCAIMPGSVAIKMGGESVTLSGLRGANDRAFGLFGNFVGGELDELGDNSEVSVWKGPGSVWQILKPAFDPTNVLTDAAAETGATGTEVYMDSAADGRLASAGTGYGDRNETARLLAAPSENTIIIELLV